MKAYAYVELYSRTFHLNYPETYYTLKFTLPSAIIGGTSSITTPNFSVFQQEIADQRTKGTKIETRELPRGVKSIDIVVVSEDGSVKAKVERIPLDKAA